MKLPSFLDRLKPAETPRLALFDADGTLWENDIADDCTIWMLGTGRIKTGHLWDEYRRVYSGDAPKGCEFLLRLFAGTSMQELKRHVDDYWHTYQKLKHIDLPVAVLQHLAKLGYEIWVVTGSPTEFLLPLLKKLPVTRIIGMDFEVDTQGIITGQRTGICCAGPGKAEKVKSLWQSPVQFAAGNALLDEAMLRIARDVAWVVHPHPELERIAKQEGWDILPAEHPPYGTAKSWPSLAEELAERGLPTPKEVKK